MEGGAKECRLIRRRPGLDEPERPALVEGREGNEAGVNSLKARLGLRPGDASQNHGGLLDLFRLASKRPSIALQC